MKFLVLRHLGDILTLNASHILSIRSYEIGDPAMLEDIKYLVEIRMTDDNESSTGYTFTYRIRGQRDKFHADLMSGLRSEYPVVRV